MSIDFLLGYSVECTTGLEATCQDQNFEGDGRVLSLEVRALAGLLDYL